MGIKMQNRVKQQKLAKGPGRSLPIQTKETVVRQVSDQKCRHMLSGRVVSKYCVYDFNCDTCSYNQMMEDENINLHNTRVATDIVAGFELAENYYYHKGHAWARIEYGGRVRVGLDDFSMRLVGESDRFKLPELGEVVHQGEACAQLSRGPFKAAALSPVEGVVVAKNPAVLGNAEIANRSPFVDGWLMVIEPLRLKANLKRLLFRDESVSWMEDESSRLSAMFADQTSYKLAATGGRAVNDIFGQLPESSWETLVKEFLLTS